MASGDQQYDTNLLIGIVKTLKLRELKPILKDLDLPRSGKVATLQDRLIDHIRTAANSRNTLAYNRIKKLVDPREPLFFPSAAENPSSYSAPRPAQSSPLPGLGGTHGARMPPQPPPTQHKAGVLTFKHSPFFDVIQHLSQVFECKVRENTRDTLIIKLSLADGIIRQLVNDNKIRVMVYGAADIGDRLHQYQSHDVAFPHQVELRVNLDEVKANMRGLKGKSGTTRPVDITNFLRKIPRYDNEIRLTASGSKDTAKKKYYIIVNLVRKIEPPDLVEKLRRGRPISKDQVLREMRDKAEDPDVTTTSTVMSLKCPLSFLRIQLPCRTSVCSHNQCFDALAFLQLQEQAPTWRCPICGKEGLAFDSLMVDKYVEDILDRTNSSIEQVTIEPDGTWSETVAGGDTTFTSSDPGAYSPDDDEDLVEVPDIRVSTLKQETTHSSPLHRTPPTSSREQSTSSSRPANNKRPSSAVIDLTGSDEDEPPRPSKRHTFDLPQNFPIRNESTHSSGSHFSFNLPNNLSRPYRTPNGY